MTTPRVSRRRTRVGRGKVYVGCEGPAAHLPPELSTRIFSMVACNRERIEFTSNKLYDAEEGEAKDNLLSCSLVSRAWRLATLPHLFHTVAFYVRHKTFEPSRHECRYDECPCRTISAFRSVVDDRAGVRVNIREVRIGQYRGPRCLYEDPEIDIVELVSLLHHLPNLRVVDLQDFTLPYRQDLWTLPCLFPQQLALDRFSYSAESGRRWASFVLDSFQPLLLTLARVGEMRFSDVMFDANRIRRLKQPITLNALKLLRCCSNDVLLDFFTTASWSWIVPGSITSMTIDNLESHDDIQAFEHTIRLVGDGIVSLALSTNYWWDSLGRTPEYDLGLDRCLLLEHLQLQFETTSQSCSDDRPTPEGVCHILSSLRPLTKLRSVTLVVSRRHLGFEPGWTPLPQKFFGPVETELLQLQSLRKVALDIIRAHGSVDPQLAVVAFPKLHQQGLL